MSVYVCICVYVYMLCPMYIQMHVHLEARGQPCVLIFKTPFTLSFETESLNSLGLPGSARLWSPLGLPVSAFPELGLRHMSPCLASYVAFGG